MPYTPKAGDVQFTYVVYNPPGTDTSSNTQLNKEYVRLTNKTKAAINLKGWTVRDRAGNVYTFTTTFSLSANTSAWVLTGKGTNNKPVNHRFWGRTTYVWNNGGDAAYLRSNTGKAIDSCSWGVGKGYTACAPCARVNRSGLCPKRSYGRRTSDTLAAWPVRRGQERRG